MAPKKSPTATVDYVNFTVNQAVEPLEKRVTNLEENSRQDLMPPTTEGVYETHTPSCIYQKNESATGMTEPTEDNPEGIMSDEEYLAQVFPDLPKWLTMSPEEHFKMVLNHYRDKAIGQLCVEEVRQIMKDYLPSIQPQIADLVKAEIRLHVNKFSADKKVVLGRLSMVDDRINKLSEHEQKFANQLEDFEVKQRTFRQDYDRAVGQSPFEKRHTGLFFFGHNVLPVWFVTLIIAVLILLCIFSTHFILDQQLQLGGQQAQIELLEHRLHKATKH